MTDLHAFGSDIHRITERAWEEISFLTQNVFEPAHRPEELSLLASRRTSSRTCFSPRAQHDLQNSFIVGEPDGFALCSLCSKYRRDLILWSPDQTYQKRVICSIKTCCCESELLLFLNINFIKKKPSGWTCIFVGYVDVKSKSLL